MMTHPRSAEAAGKNQFSTGTLSHSDIENHSRYKGKSIGLGGGFGFNGKGSQELGDTGIQLAAQGQHTGGVANGEGLQGAKTSKSIGYGQDSDSQSSVTRSGIGTDNIRIGDDGSGEQAKAVYTDTTTETAAARSGSLVNNFDAAKVQNELDLQRSVSQAFDNNRQAAKAEINQKRTELEEKLKEKTLSVEEAQVYQKEIDKLDNLALLLDTVSAGLYTPSNSTGGSLMAASSPAMTQKIGEIFKPGGAMVQYEGTALHGAAQGIWAAAVAYAGGNDPLSAGVSAGVSEVAVPVLGNWLFPDKDKADYTAEEKQTLSAIAGVLSAGGTLAAGGSATDAAAANVAAINAVENNYLKQEDWNEYIQKRDFCIRQNNSKCFKDAEKALLLTSEERNKTLMRACTPPTGNDKLCSKLVADSEYSRKILTPNMLKKLGLNVKFSEHNDYKWYIESQEPTKTRRAPIVHPAFVAHKDIPWIDNPAIHFVSISLDLERFKEQLPFLKRPEFARLGSGFNIVYNKVKGEVLIGLSGIPQQNENSKDNTKNKNLSLKNIRALLQQ